MKYRKIIAAVLILAVGFVILLIIKPPKKEISGKIRIIASFYPLAEFVHQIGQEKTEVINITPVGAEPHDFEPTAKDIAGIYNSEMFVFNSSGFQPWADKVVSDLGKTDVTVVDSSQNINLIDADPHFWLDPVSAIKQVENITRGLIKTDQSNREFYEKNARNYIQKLVDLDNEIKLKLNHCRQKQIITSHAVFAYLARNYNLQAISIAGISPNEEPSPQHIAEIMKIAGKDKIKYIFFETLVSPKLSETVANEIGAKTLVFNPLEGLAEEDLALGKNYLSIQRDNINNLLIALECL